VLVNRCCLCKANGESVDHLLLHCPLAKAMWDSVLSIFWSVLGNASPGEGVD
jgi:hypothetical protein